MRNPLIKPASLKYNDFHPNRTFYIWIFLLVLVTSGCAGSSDGGSALQLGLDDPTQIVVETNTNGTTALVLEKDSGEISRIDLDTLKITETLITGLNNPEGFAIDRGGSSALVIENTSSVRLVRANLSDNSISVVCPSLNLDSPSGIVLENSGEVLVIEKGGLSEIDFNVPGGCSPTPINPSLNNPAGIALELGGSSVLVTESSPNDGRLIRILLNSGQPEDLAENLKAPSGVAILPTGSDALVVQTGNGSVVKVAIAGPQSPSPSTVITGLTHPRGIAVNLQGDTAFVTVSDGIVSIPVPFP